MSMLVVIALLVVAGLVVARLTEFVAVALWAVGALVVVALLATVGGAVFGWGGAVAVIGGAAYLYARPGRPVPQGTRRCRCSNGMISVGQVCGACRGTGYY